MNVSKLLDVLTPRGQLLAYTYFTKLQGDIMNDSIVNCNNTITIYYCYYSSLLLWIQIKHLVEID